MGRETAMGKSGVRGESAESLQDTDDVSDEEAQLSFASV